MSEPIVLVVANQKGGVGKTTTAVNLAAGLARKGVETLLVDLDIQGSASATLGVTPADDAVDVARVLLDERPLDAAIAPTRLPHLSVAPAVQGFDVVVVDTAPYLGLLTVNALVAAHEVLVPVSCEYLPMLGLKLLGETLSKLRERAGAKARVLGYLLTMVDRRERITAEVEALLRKRFGDEVLETVIRANTQHKAAPSHRKTIFEHEPAGGKGREDYEALTREVMGRLGLAKKPAKKPRAKG